MSMDSNTAAYVRRASTHLVAVASMMAVMLWFSGAQLVAWVLSFLFVSGLAVPIVLSLLPWWRPPCIGEMLLPAAFTFKRDTEGLAHCCICLGLVGEGHKVRLLPACGHLFHAGCVQQWLHAHPTCPLCRADVRAAAPRRPEV